MTEKDFIKLVGREIAKQRQHAGMTQSEVAARLKVEKETISRLETGVISPSLSRLHQLSAIFSCPVRHFFWQEKGSGEEQAEIIMEMLNTLPGPRRERLVRCVAQLVEALRD